MQPRCISTYDLYSARLIQVVSNPHPFTFSPCQLLQLTRCIKKQTAQPPAEEKPTIEPTWENIWECAYDKLAGASSDLLKEYLENLRKMQDGDSADTKDAANTGTDGSHSTYLRSIYKALFNTTLRLSPFSFH